MGARVKVTGYIEAEEHQLDPDHSTGLTSEGYDDLTEEFLGLEDVTFEVVYD